ncbi:hypothetical protein Btru_064508 [Bulinus truncatus]|nr:hypothetical protein Btru_064508 [Bulinus truncatus]
MPILDPKDQVFVLLPIWDDKLKISRLLQIVFDYKDLIQEHSALLTEHDDTSEDLGTVDIRTIRWVQQTETVKHVAISRDLKAKEREDLN